MGAGVSPNTFRNPPRPVKTGVRPVKEPKSQEKACSPVPRLTGIECPGSPSRLVGLGVVFRFGPGSYPDRTGTLGRYDGRCRGSRGLGRVRPPVICTG